VGEGVAKGLRLPFGLPRGGGRGVSPQNTEIILLGAELKTAKKDQYNMYNAQIP